MSKDKRTFIRLCPVIHSLFTALTYHLAGRDDDETECTIPLEIPKEITTLVCSLVEYFSSQRKILGKVNVHEKANRAAEAKNTEENNDDLINCVATHIINCCEDKSADEVACFAKQTTYNDEIAVCFRVEDFPITPTFKKSDVQRYLTQNKDAGVFSLKRDLDRPKRCTILLMKVFDEVLQTKLRAGLKGESLQLDVEDHVEQELTEPNSGENTADQETGDDYSEEPDTLQNREGNVVRSDTLDEEECVEKQQEHTIEPDDKDDDYRDRHLEKEKTQVKEGANEAEKGINKSDRGERVCKRSNSRQSRRIAAKRKK